MATGKNAKLCPCHGEPVLWHLDPRYTAGGYPRCRVHELEGQRRRYATMPGSAYNRKLFLNRRNKALARVRARHERRES